MRKIYKQINMFENFLIKHKSFELFYIGFGSGYGIEYRENSEWPTELYDYYREIPIVDWISCAFVWDDIGNPHIDWFDLSNKLYRDTKDHPSKWNCTLELSKNVKTI